MSFTPDTSCNACTRFFDRSVSRSTPVYRTPDQPRKNKVYCPACYGVPLTAPPPPSTWYFWGLAAWS